MTDEEGEDDRIHVSLFGAINYHGCIACHRIVTSVTAGYVRRYNNKIIELLIDRVRSDHKVIKGVIEVLA
jgi:hypothetical protein